MILRPWKRVRELKDSFAWQRSQTYELLREANGRLEEAKARETRLATAAARTALRLRREASFAKALRDVMRSALAKRAERIEALEARVRDLEEKLDDMGRELVECDRARERLRESLKRATERATGRGTVLLRIHEVLKVARGEGVI